MDNINNNKVSRIVWLSSVFLALFIDVRALNWTLVYGGFVPIEEGGLMANIYLYTAILLSVCAVCSFTVTTKRMNYSGLLLSSYLLFWYYVTLCFWGPPETSILMFLVMTVFALIIPQFICIDARIFLKTVMLLPSIAIFRINEVFIIPSGWSMQLPMDVSYGFLVPIISSIVYWKTFFKSESGWKKWLTVTSFSCNVVFLILLLLYGSRGPLLSIVLLFCFYYICKWENGQVTVNYSKRRRIMIFLTIFLLTGIFAFSILSSLLESFGIKSYAIDKMIQLGDEGNLSNGRGNLNALTMNYVLDRPIWGYGLDRFNALTNMQYPHNLFMQLLFDGGIVLLLIVFIPVYKSIKVFFKNCIYSEYILVVTLFFVSVPGSMVSGNIWHIVPLWVFIGSILKLKKI
ncbi:MAG: O-antigen ligase family protein [Prevotella sp.]|nr:O-antigen ligase family protein [Candidatus Prevotella equi]